MPFQYGKVPISANAAQQLNLGGQGISGIVVGNESGLTCTLELQGANSKTTLYPGTVDFVPTPSGRNWNGNLLVTPSSDLNNANFWPSSHIYIDVYGLGEAPKGAYPLALNRAGNIGNQVTLAVGSSTSVQNDNNAANTVFVESTVLGSPSSNTSMSNDGSGWLGRWNNPTFTKIFQWFSSGTTALQLGAANFLTEILGALKIDSNLTVLGTSSLDNGAVTTNGNGQVTMTTLVATNTSVGTETATTVSAGTVSASGNISAGGTVSNVNGVLQGIFMLATPFLLDNNGSLAQNASATETVTGGSTGVPTGAKAVILSNFFTGSAVGTFLQWKPHNATVNNTSNYPIVITQVALQIAAGTFIVGCDASGKIDVTAKQGNTSSVNTSIIGYII